MSEEDKRLTCALDLFRRLPPSQLETNLAFVTELVPDLADDLLQTVDCPLKVQTCPTTKKEFLYCDYNRDGDSYRSPYSNTYVPALEGEDVSYPSEELRKMEIEANELFQVYTDLYYEGGLCNSYFWEVETGFACCVLIRKDGGGIKGVDKGIWNSIHVCEVVCDPNAPSGKATYKLTTTIMLTLNTKGKSPSIDLSGSVVKQTNKETSFDKSDCTHLVNIGLMVQEVENSLLNSLQEVYFDKAREITRTLRNPMTKSTRVMRSDMNQELQFALSNRKR